MLSSSMLASSISDEFATEVRKERVRRLAEDLFAFPALTDAVATACKSQYNDWKRVIVFGWTAEAKEKLSQSIAKEASASLVELVGNPRRDRLPGILM
jgi:hypothetical protein